MALIPLAQCAEDEVSVLSWGMVFRLIFWIGLALLAFPNLMSGQDIGGTGEFTVSWRDINFNDTHYNRGRVYGRIYYPAITSGSNAIANPGQGPYPLIGFMHGWIEPASDYDSLCKHLASWGFVVMSNDTETGLFGSMQPQAEDTRALMQWVEDKSATAGTWLEGMTANQPWGAIGHSMGASALSYLVRDESRVTSLVMFEPYKGSLLGNTASGFNSFIDYPGDVVVIAGDEDLTNNWNSAGMPWFQQADSAERRLWNLIEGGDHFGCTDSDIHALWGGGSLSGDSQHLVHRQLATGFFLAELKGLENHYHAYFQTPYSSKKAKSIDTPLWVVIDPSSPNELTFGSFTINGRQLRIAGSLGTGSTQTVWGEFGLDLSSMRMAMNVTADANGIEYSSGVINSSWQGLTLWFQALSNSGVVGKFSRVTSVTIP